MYCPRDDTQSLTGTTVVIIIMSASNLGFVQADTTQCLIESRKFVNWGDIALFVAFLNQTEEEIDLGQTS